MRTPKDQAFPAIALARYASAAAVVAAVSTTVLACATGRAAAQAIAPPSAPATAAKVLFGAVRQPSTAVPSAIGEYAKGCLAGARPLPVNGPAWQVMRLSRNRNWGHPALIAWLGQFARDARAHDGWNGMLIGDMSQPRGGPMITGHASHQIGLDADIWFAPMPARVLTPQERETMSAVSLVKPDKLTLEPAWDAAHMRIIERAAASPQLERVFVNPAIKKQLCAAHPTAADRGWLAKVRPWWGHDDHFHIRIACPPDSSGCKPQKPVPADDTCGKELTDWLKDVTAPEPPPPPPGTPVKPPRPPMTLAALPAECRDVLGMAAIPAPERAKPTAAEIPKWRTEEIFHQ